jgi:hypothetical protein
MAAAAATAAAAVVVVVVRSRNSLEVRKQNTVYAFTRIQYIYIYYNA